jgi:hypothetical protein
MKHIVTVRVDVIFTRVVVIEADSEVEAEREAARIARDAIEDQVTPLRGEIDCVDANVACGALIAA